jgi:hypothetical protein
MRFRTKLSALLAVLLFAFTFLGGTGVGAQDDMESELQLSDLEGIQHGVSRTYSVDYSALMENMSTPGAELEMPSGLVTLSAIVLEFEEGGNAEDAYSAVVDELGDEELAVEGVEEVDIDLGDQNKSVAGVEDFGDGTESDVFVTIVQKDNYLYVIYAGSSEIDLQETVVEFTNILIDNDGSGEGEFNEDGTSTGGLWDKFPAADDELISGLTTFDTIIYPETEDGEEG